MQPTAIALCNFEKEVYFDSCAHKKKHSNKKMKNNEKLASRKKEDCESNEINPFMESFTISQSMKSKLIADKSIKFN